MKRFWIRRVWIPIYRWLNPRFVLKFPEPQWIENGISCEVMRNVEVWSGEFVPKWETARLVSMGKNNAEVMLASGTRIKTKTARIRNVKMPAALARALASTSFQSETNEEV